ncbi:MAG TPA: serine/threonine-protein kinase [Tepidisphaeraceae bacterium]|jgi:serine/threonine-protein kinase|nr:serine/threonine-protein kinase [Tepidisphaeraceae bacterium]
MAQANQRISEYVLDERVGAGTFGEVWRAHHHVWNDQIVGIKIPTDAQYVRNLQREGAAIHGLIHPNIVRALGFDPYADPAYLVMEYVPGTSLRPLVRERKLSIDDAVSVMRQVLAGLQHAHAAGIIHRDVKPENILIHERALREGYAAEGVVKVTDFGLGRVANQTSAAGSIAYSASMNDRKDIGGTLDYMSPEQRSGAELDARADVYACGVVLYEMLTGEKPAGTEVPSDLNPAVPKYLDEVFRRAYARLEKRFATAGEFLAALASSGPPPLPFQRSAYHACPHCRRPVDPTDQFCMHCGMQLAAQVRRCGECGAYPDVHDRYCMFCGTALDVPRKVVGV